MGLKGEIEELINKADSVFKAKWEVLCFLKEPANNPELVKSIVDFQIDLADMLVDIEKFRQKIVKEEKRLKKNISRYKKDWFIARMKTLAHYRKMLLKFNVMGKSIGDAFVFWFYRFDLELLNEHFNHERTLYPPLGIGGTGELEFVRKIRIVDGKIGIYHGITNILRIGDVSFFDFKKLNIVSIGEIKTKKTGENTIDISLLLFAPKERKMFKDIDRKKMEPSKMDYFDNDRLERQLKSMGEALQVYIPSISNLNFDQNIQEEFNCQAIEKLYKKSSPRKLSFIQSSEGLFFSGIKSKSKNPIRKYFSSNQFKPSEIDINNVKDYILKITKKTTTQNPIIHGQLQYDRDHLDNAIRGAVPLFWMPIKNEILKDIYFEDFSVMSIFNPIHLIEKLANDGVLVKSNYLRNEIPVRNEGYPKIIAEFFDLYIPFIMGFLQTEQSIIKIFDTIKKEFSDKQKMGSVKLEIRMQQKIDKYMSKPSTYNPS